MNDISEKTELAIQTLFDAVVENFPKASSAKLIFELGMCEIEIKEGYWTFRRNIRRDTRIENTKLNPNQRNRI